MEDSILKALISLVIGGVGSGVITFIVIKTRLDIYIPIIKNSQLEINNLSNKIEKLITREEAYKSLVTKETFQLTNGHLEDKIDVFDKKLDQILAAVQKKG